MDELGRLGNVLPAKNDLPLSACGFDAFEIAVLEVARRFFITFSRPESHGWVEAFETAERKLSPPFGATLAVAVMRAIQVLRGARSTTFNFIPPDCPICSRTITQEERYLISILKAVRKRRRSEAMTHALLVCEGSDPEALVIAFETLCVLIGEGPLADPSRP
ncbi:MAG: hypothetical protein AAGF44_05900 [Pseudomonadota bacterium]